MRKQSVLSVPSQAAASNRPNIHPNHFFTSTFTRCLPVQLHLLWHISIETIIFNQFFITRSPMIHQSTRARHDTHSKKTGQFHTYFFPLFSNLETTRSHQPTSRLSVMAFFKNNSLNLTFLERVQQE